MDARARIQRIARDSVLEPFAVHRNLDTLKKTRQTIESGVRKISRAARATGGGLQKAGSALRAGWDGARKLRQRFSSSPATPEHSRPAPMAPPSPDESDWAGRLRGAAAAMATVARSSWEEAGRWANTSGIQYLEDGFRLFLDRDGERWIVKRASQILDREDLSQLEDVRALDFGERDTLIARLYPYRHPALRDYIQALDQAMNISLGATVATNLPFTGVAVGALNIVKTILKIGGRISTMTWLYGRRIAGPEALFRVSARLLMSLEAWESDPEHEPLSPDVLDELFQSDGSSRAFRELLEAATRKDAYIAVPGVGTVGLGKIPLDDFRMNLYVQHLAMDYFEREPLHDLVGAEEYDASYAQYRAVYRELMHQEAIAVLSARVEAARPVPVDGRDRWLARWRALTGTDGIAEEVSNELDAVARRVQERRGRGESSESPALSDLVRDELGLS